MFRKNTIAPIIVEAQSTEPAFKPVLISTRLSQEQFITSTPLPKKKWYEKTGRLLAAWYGTLVTAVIIIAICL